MVKLDQRVPSDRAGSSAVEFALVLPLSLVMICGILQYGVLFYAWNVALYGARNAARAVAVGRATASGGETMMRNAMPIWMTGSGGTTAITAKVTDAAVGGDVIAQLQFSSANATFLKLAPMPATLSVTVRMVKEA